MKPGSIASPLEAIDTPAVIAPAMPPEAPLALHAPALHRRPTRLRRSARPWTQRLRLALTRLLVLALTLALCTFGIREAHGVIAAGGITPLEWAFLVLFALNFSWVALTLAQSVIGFAVSRSRDRRAPRARTLRTALLIPVYQEDANSVGARALAMAEAIAAAPPTSQEGAVAIFLLSDTRDSGAILTEETVFADAAQRAPQGCPLYYRRRRDNHERKAGNIADWVARQGAAWDAMVILDADSLMSADCVSRLAARLEANPDLGLIQTLPVVAGGRTLFARLQQFAGACYGALHARGLAAWHGRSGNYWGHNAIIRIEAFAEAARLPVLPGNPPFGGHLLSHDFIEAAFLRRAGWGVRFDADLGGSYEEAPPSLVETIVRDRRWCQGNLQHARVLGARGLRTMSRLHLLQGIYAYLSAPVWFALILCGLGLALQVQLVPPDYFAEPSLFPTWPVFDTERAVQLLGVTVAVVLAPKLLSLVHLLLQPRRWRAFAGPLNLTASVVFETLASALYAPVLMAAQCRTVAAVLVGADSGWKPQQREGARLAFVDACRAHWFDTLLGISLAATAAWVERDLLYWLAPLTLGLVLSIPLSMASASTRLGRFTHWLGLGRVPSECQPHALVARVAHWRERLPQATPEPSPLRRLALDRQLRRWHCAQLPAPPSQVTDYEEALLSALAKADRCTDIEELADWLDGPQLKALINYRPFFENFDADRQVVVPPTAAWRRSGAML
ncbi:MAG: glucans biosynthesis glucosyltransferase MdoH [Pseudomonadota bacterium]